MERLSTYDRLNPQRPIHPGEYVGPSKVTFGDYEWWMRADGCLVLAPAPPPNHAWSIGPFEVIRDPTIPPDTFIIGAHGLGVRMWDNPDAPDLGHATREARWRLHETLRLRIENPRRSVTVSLEDE